MSVSQRSIISFMGMYYNMQSAHKWHVDDKQKQIWTTEAKEKYYDS